MTRRSGIIITFICAATMTAVACRRDTPPKPKTAQPASSAATTTTFERKDLRGVNLDMKLPLTVNAVAKCSAVKETFAQGEPIQLALQLNEAPEGLVVAARLLDSDREEIAYVKEPATGKKSATVAITNKVKSGSYTLEGYWGGNLVCEHPVTVE